MTPPSRDSDRETIQEQSLGLPYPGAPRLSSAADSDPPASLSSLSALQLGLPVDPEQSIQPDKSFSTVQPHNRSLFAGLPPLAQGSCAPARTRASAGQDHEIGPVADQQPLSTSQQSRSLEQASRPQPLTTSRHQGLPLFDSNRGSVGDFQPGPPRAATPSGPLILKEFLASGGFGEVWTGDQQSLGRTIAIKRIREGLIKELPDPAMRAGLEDMFRAEACITASLEHPNIVPVYDIGHDESGQPILAMKLVRGETWRDTLRREYWELAPADFLMKHIPILVQVCQAVAFAHGLGVIHRDLKPSQVMLGDYGEVLLMDWGLAMKCDGEALPPALPSEPKPADRRSGLSGTLAYMAPEQAIGDALLIGPWTDIFLLGAMLYELLTGAPPYRASSSLEVLNLATAGRVDPPSTRAIPRPVPRELEIITMRAMARNPGDRYPSARDFILALQDWMTGAGRRRESMELAQKADQTLTTAGHSYAFITAALSQLTNAQVLWNENPEIPILLNKAHSQFALAAIDNDDLVLARLQAGMVQENTIRSGLLAKVELAARDVRARARQRLLLLIVVWILIAAIIGGVITFSAEQARASRELQTSNSRMTLQMAKAALTREQAETLLTFMLEDLRPRLEPTGQIALLDGIGQQALRYFDTLDWEQSTTQGLQRQILALNQVALVQQAQNRIPQALETANESVRKSERLLTLTREPDTVMLIAAGAAHSLRGMLLARRNEESSATADLTKAGNILQQALVAAPLDPQIRLEYAQTLNRLAFLATRAGELKSATELNSRALPLVQPPVTVPLNAWPPATLHSAAQILADLATGHATMGNLEQAARNLGLGVDYLREALRRQPDYDLWRLALWRLLDSLGNVELDRGDADAAQESFASALTTIENLTSRDDGNTRFAAARVVALARLSAVPMQLGRWNDARTMLERAQATAETIIARNGTQGDGRDVLALVRENLSRVLRRTDRGREAMAYAQQALIARETARREEPSSVARHTELISSQIHAAEAAIAAGETTTALRYASQAREEANVLIQRAPQSFHWRVLSAAADMAHSDASRAVGNTGDADSSALGALDTLRLIEGGITPDIPSPALTIVIRAQEAIGKASDIKSLRETMAHRGIDQGWAAAPGSPRR